ncbi:non-hydrolyzing UDP-N-acetylglucosamine 2-epimerase [Halomicrobium katesii]|uniref:non-hydrolyzing UDP-N-acetylglucosamine 2-epimerase n=1 Tax=Halomicrobium katesii TaxID=437163 RepID=UPI000377EA69|nr:UDP-N-acetylglucosamine 2-epimerase (non-hydrolyzing) [Halomicrobium katesii]
MEQNPTIAFVFGTRPEIIKLAPVLRACENRDISYIQIHTGQHYSDSLDSIFFDQLNLPIPEYNLEVGSQSHGQQTGEMIAEIETVLTETRPETVLVQGDTNSVLAGAIATSKLPAVDLAHIEAGLRSFDREMPEEINRRLTDHAAEYLFPPTESAREHLREENIPDDRITVTGNTIVDAVTQHVELAHRQSSVHETLDLDQRYALLTAHRAKNVDDEDRLKSLLEGVARSAREHDLTVVYPIHPRAESQLADSGVEVPEVITLIEPQPFLDFLVLEDDATLIFTDSGGVQEEACILGMPCVTLRDNTERPETVTVGANRVAGVDPDDIAAAADAMIDIQEDWDNPFGDGTAAEKIVEEVRPR